MCLIEWKAAFELAVTSPWDALGKKAKDYNRMLPAIRDGGHCPPTKPAAQEGLVLFRDPKVTLWRG